MVRYELSPGADKDLQKIVDDSTETWGVRRTRRYQQDLEDHFEALVAGETFTRAIIPNRPDLRSSRCERHYVFSVERDGQPLLILAILHERMDLMTRLVERLRSDTLISST